MPMFGAADLHAHFVSHVGFGGKLIWGNHVPASPTLHGDAGLASALSHCDPIHGPGGVIPSPEGIGHLVGGFPEFDGWPVSTTSAHQQAYVDWIRRSWEVGGLRLVVCLAVNNEFATSHAIAPQQFPADDVGSVDTQLRAMRDLVDFVDTQDGGPEKGFIQIASDPTEAARLVANGKLAMVPGIEVSALGGFKTPEELTRRTGGDLAEARRLIAVYLDHVYALGARHIFPLHLANNAFGGTAVCGLHSDAINLHYTGHRIEVEDGSGVGVDFRIDRAKFNDMEGFQGWVAEAILAYPGGRPANPASWATGAGGHINQQGLTEYGAILIEEIVRRGMMIDIDHMSHKTLQDVLVIVERIGYPVVSGHSGFRELQRTRAETASSRRTASEVNHSADTVKRVRRLGGMVAPILNQWDLRDCGCDRPVPNDAAGSSKTFAQALLYANDRMGFRNVGFASDINGLAGLPGPRFGPRAAENLHDDKKRGGLRRQQALAQTGGVRYSDRLVEYRDSRFPIWSGGLGGQDGAPFNGEERDIWEAIAIHKSGVRPDHADQPPVYVRTVWQAGKIINLAKGFGYDNRRQVENPFLGGNTEAEQLAAFKVARGVALENGDPEETKRLHTVIGRMWSLWAEMESGPNKPIPRSKGGRRDWDINLDGMAHYGMLPDFIEDLKNIGVSKKDIDTLYRAADDYTRVWQRCLRRSVQARSRRIAFHANTGMLFSTDGEGNAKDLGFGLAAGTSPAVACDVDGGFRIAFHANTGMLFSTDGEGNAKDLGFGLAAGTSPAVACDVDGGFRIAFHANTGMLFSTDGEGNAKDLGFGLAAGTSPAIVPS
jgi:microsomal dipeptidase-like Zn-dependent dipeptidase